MKRFETLAVAIIILILATALRSEADLFNKRSAAVRIGPNPTAIAAADLNSDGWPDIVTADTGLLADPREERPANDELSLLIAQGNLEYAKYTPSLKTGFAPYAIEIANVDARKWPDILVA
ncbi:MAG: VCBS repeat-containing protein, partial [Candidatus Hydrogenedentes bacterium]|nr:VCBS repeat-containing protein [Candidatus Hydrogenedentota bacterium]